jgi:hypothetical protein
MQNIFLTMNQYLFFLLALIILPFYLRAQDDTDAKEPDPAWGIYAAYAYQWPGGDMANRFGTSSSIGPGFFHKTKSNWIFDAGVNFIFGNTINEDSLVQNLINSRGFIIDDQGLIAEVSFFQSGLYSHFKMGKLFPVKRSNPNSGIVLMAGAGYLRHRINIEVTNKAASPLAGDYEKGYDRMTDGFSTSFFIGYMHLGNTRLANFFAGFEFEQAWTKNRRSMNFDTMRRDEEKRFDLLSGFKIGWVMPFNKRQPLDYYYY